MLQNGVQPILARLLELQGSSENLKHLLQLLRIQQSQAPLQPGYFAGNAINLLTLGFTAGNKYHDLARAYESDLFGDVCSRGAYARQQQ